MASGIELSFVIFREEGREPIFSVTSRRHIAGCLWDARENLYQGPSTLVAINTLSRKLQEEIGG